MAEYTFVEKVFASTLNLPDIRPGQIVDAPITYAMSHDNAGLVIRKFHEIGTENVWDPQRIVIILDHRIPANNEQTATVHKQIREFVRKQKIPNFYDINMGVCHQVLQEQGFVQPARIIVGTDSHTTTHGALSAFSTGIGATDMAGIWATGNTWFRIPESLQITLTGSRAPEISAKDIILHIIGDLSADGASYMSVEFTGEISEKLIMADRLTLCNMAMEMGAKSAAFPPNQVLQEYLSNLPLKGSTTLPLWADPEASYSKQREYDLSGLSPQVACPHAVDNVKPVEDVSGLPIDQALIGTCTNGRIEDLRIAAQILKSKQVKQGVRLLIIPASRAVFQSADQEGLISVFLAAGAVVCNPGCGPCLGAHQGILASEERCISTSNRNFQGRMGSKNAEVYLASPATVAASAVAGEITNPKPYFKE